MIPTTMVKAKQSLILVTEDNEDLCKLFSDTLKLDGFQILIAKNKDDTLHLLHNQVPEMVFLNISAPQMNGVSTLQHIKKLYPSLPVIIITEYSFIQEAGTAMCDGAFDYLTLPLDEKRIREVVQRVQRSLMPGSKDITTMTSLYSNFIAGNDMFAGSSKVMQEVYKLIASIAATPNGTSVLILGERGTGKELVAKAIHNNSTSAHEPFVPILCASATPHSLENEVFGQTTKLSADPGVLRKGTYATSGGGTFFFDEIGESSQGMQMKLHDILQERRQENTGRGTSAPAYARFIAATRHDLAREVEQGRFREDLFYKLNVVTINLPPLRHRKNDIPELAHYFLTKYNAAWKKELSGFSPAALHYLLSHPLPGNIRELGNRIEHAVIAATGNTVELNDFQAAPARRTLSAEALPIKSMNFSEARDSILGLFERQFLDKLLTQFGGNVSEAAKTSRMTRQNLQRLMKKYGIEGKNYRDA